MKSQLKSWLGLLLVRGDTNMNFAEKMKYTMKVRGCGRRLVLPVVRLSSGGSCREHASVNLDNVDEIVVKFTAYSATYAMG
mmetsp:Transcript_10014/g.15014  ORF Transcript_10014/g.15014 Transcript_10014/m.15014 type:complete len:81 (+) Transcript_10014:1305-1547(+)